MGRSSESGGSGVAVGEADPAAHEQAQQRAGQADERALQQEDLPDLRLVRAHGLQDRDLSALVEHEHRHVSV